MGDDDDWFSFEGDERFEREMKRLILAQARAEAREAELRAEKAVVELEQAHITRDAMAQSLERQGIQVGSPPVKSGLLARLGKER